MDVGWKGVAEKFVKTLLRSIHLVRKGPKRGQPNTLHRDFLNNQSKKTHITYPPLALATFDPMKEACLTSAGGVVGEGSAHL